jgi:hypothetical protein
VDAELASSRERFFAGEEGCGEDPGNCSSHEDDEGCALIPGEQAWEDEDIVAFCGWSPWLDRWRTRNVSKVSPPSALGSKRASSSVIHGM